MPHSYNSYHNRAMMSGHHGHHPQHPYSDDECVAFVGNLSYFCREKDLYELFSPYCYVKNVRVMYNEDRSRSLMFGFVELTSEHEVQSMITLLNGNMFMGRRLRVSPSDRYLQRTQGITNKQLMKSHQLAMQQGFQIHVAFSSSFPPDKVNVPTECFLLKVFIRFGLIIDCHINHYVIHPDRFSQEGYAFVTFRDESSMIAVLENPQYLLEGITLTCTQTNRQTGGNRPPWQGSAGGPNDVAGAIASAQSLALSRSLQTSVGAAPLNLNRLPQSNMQVPFFGPSNGSGKSSGSNSGGNGGFNSMDRFSFNGNNNGAFTSNPSSFPSYSSSPDELGFVESFNTVFNDLLPSSGSLNKDSVPLSSGSTSSSTSSASSWSLNAPTNEPVAISTF